MEKTKVLIVDDNIDACKVLEELINKQKDMYVVGIARNGLEAIELVKEVEPDIMLLDIIIPEFDGLEVLRRLQRLKPKVMVISSLYKDSITRQAFNLGADSYIAKPIDFENTLEKLRALIYKDDNRKVEKKISELLVNMDLPVYLSGYKYIKEAIKIIIEGKTIDVNMNMIYETVSKKFETTSNRVKNNIRHVIEHKWYIGADDSINMMFQEKPSPKEFLTQVAEKIISEM